MTTREAKRKANAAIRNMIRAARQYIDAENELLAAAQQEARGREDRYELPEPVPKPPSAAQKAGTSRRLGSNFLVMRDVA